MHLVSSRLVLLCLFVPVVAHPPAALKKDGGCSKSCESRLGVTNCLLSSAESTLPVSMGESITALPPIDKGRGLKTDHMSIDHRDYVTGIGDS